MSLPTAAVDRLFQRLAATYGLAWDRALGNAPVGDVKSAWAHELAGFARRLNAVAWALEHLPERCPNVIEFRNLCRRAPEPETPRLPEPKADPERVREELRKLGEIRRQIGTPGADTGWARRIVARSEWGERIAPLVLKMAREALLRNSSSQKVEAA